MPLTTLSFPDLIEDQLLMEKVADRRLDAFMVSHSCLLYTSDAADD